MDGMDGDEGEQAVHAESACLNAFSMLAFGLNGRTLQCDKRGSALPQGGSSAVEPVGRFDALSPEQSKARQGNEGALEICIYPGLRRGQQISSERVHLLVIAFMHVYCDSQIPFWGKRIGIRKSVSPCLFPHAGCLSATVLHTPPEMLVCNPSSYECPTNGKCCQWESISGTRLAGH